MVEYLKVLNSRACLRILNSRVPKGDGGLNSRACLRILMVEYLKVLWSSASGPLPMVEPAYASLTVEPAYASLSVEPPVGSLVHFDQ
jgi:hypothetical protein